VKRKLFTLAAALSLVLCLAMVVLLTGSWLRGGRMLSVSVKGLPRSDGTRTEYLMECHEGRVGAGAVRDLTPPPPPVSPAWVRARRVFIWRRFGFDVMFGENVSCNAHWQNVPPTSVWYDAETYFVERPFWIVIGLGLSLPVIWMRCQLRERRALRVIGCCKTCGYDLRASPDRCPECGTSVVKPQT
jgi:hypothetical protein